jgi:23S rRNA (adenine2503-C2)-methyltransferase
MFFEIFASQIQLKTSFFAIFDYMNLCDVKSFSEDELRNFLLELGQKKYRADQIADWMYNHGADNWDMMANIPKDLRLKLESKVVLRSLTEMNREISSDGTVKWAYKTQDGFFIETVLIPSEERNSVCVSTQVGCGMGCTFCRTSKMGLKRNLESGEILEQFIRTKQFLKEFERGELTNIIYMGMGEPLHNFDNVMKSIYWLHHQKYFQISRKRITLSTSGLVPRIYELADAAIPAQLAVSLNGTNDEMRRSIMPINQRYPISQLLESVDYYIEKTGNYVTFEYVLIQDLTCTTQAAQELSEIIRNRSCKVNAIVLNQSDDPKLKAPDADAIENFLTIVRSTGKHVSIRQPRGRDIKAACGQLAIHQQKVA